MFVFTVQINYWVYLVLFREEVIGTSDLSLLPHLYLCWWPLTVISPSYIAAAACKAL